MKRPAGGFGRYLLAPLDWLDGGYSPRDSSVVRQDETAGVELDNVSAGYAGRAAIAGVSGRFASGSLTAVVGPNGAGKSSLLKVIAGTLPLQFGSIRCAARLAHDFAYMPQQAELDRTFPIVVRDLIALGGWRNFGAYRRVGDNVFARVAEAAASAGLDGHLDRPVERLSVGEFQRALFARLLLQDATVILLDEPFAAVDERTTEDLLRLVERWHKEGRTVIAVLHDLERVREFFPQALLLARSCIAWGDTGSVLTTDNLARARDLMQGRLNGRAA